MNLYDPADKAKAESFDDFIKSNDLFDPPIAEQLRTYLQAAHDAGWQSAWDLMEARASQPDPRTDF